MHDVSTPHMYTSTMFYHSAHHGVGRAKNNTAVKKPSMVLFGVRGNREVFITKSGPHTISWCSGHNHHHTTVVMDSLLPAVAWFLFFLPTYCSWMLGPAAPFNVQSLADMDASATPRWRPQPSRGRLRLGGLLQPRHVFLLHLWLVGSHWSPRLDMWAVTFLFFSHLWSQQKCSTAILILVNYALSSSNMSFTWF